MAKLYYGGGSVSIDGSNIRGVEIRYRGAVTITDKTPDSFAITHQGNGIMIFPIGEGTLGELFDYRGELRIISVLVADNNAEKVPTTIHKNMDFSQLLGNSEDLTTNSEDLSAGYVSGSRLSKTTLKQPIIPNLRTSTWDIDLYLESGEAYSGLFHVHLKDNNAMTGGEHSKDSQELYFKKTGEETLTLFKNPDLVPLARVNKKIKKSKHAYTTIQVGKTRIRVADK